MDLVESLGGDDGSAPAFERIQDDLARMAGIVDRRGNISRESRRCILRLDRSEPPTKGIDNALLFNMYSS